MPVPVAGPRRILWWTIAVLLACLPASPRSQSQPAAYTLYTTTGPHALPFRTNNNVDFVSLRALTPIFGLSVAEDALAGGLTVQARGQTILLIPGQTFVSLGGGRIVSLPAAVRRDRGEWEVPVEFIRVALGPALGVPVEVRRASHLVLVGDVRLPHVSGRFDRQGTAGRLTLDIAPPAPHRVTRAGNQLTVRFDAVAVDYAPVTGLAPELVSAIRANGPSLVIDLGPSAATFHAEDGDPARVVIDLLPPGAPPPAPAPPAAPAAPPAAGAASTAPPPPVVDTTPAGTIRTVVIDPGHGGDDVGSRGVGGTKEKDLVLALARKLQATIEGRIGLRVVLTRSTDENVPLDRRTAIANNNKADLFIGLHANASLEPAVSGAQVLSLALDTYNTRAALAATNDLPVPVVGGGSRSIDIVPWDLAQIPYANQSAVLAATVARHLSEHGVPLFARPTARLPLRSLVAANMPAVLVEVGFLTNAGDEHALTSDARQNAIVDAILDAIADARRGALTAPPPARTEGTR
jgi:N-acetylmuramoyl-L-alanine amidase